MSNLNFWGKLNKLREDIKLSDERKFKIRDYLINEIDGTNLESTYGKHTKKGIFWSQLVLSKYQKRYVPIIAGFIIVVILGSGVSFAAENSLPGDLLYLVKVNINEEVLGSLTFGVKAKTEYEADLATKRLEEAEQLTVSGKMDEETQDSIETNFEKHSKKVSDGIAQVQSETGVTDAAEISSKFETTLSAHEQILRKLGDEASPSVQSHSRGVEGKVKARLKDASLKRSEFDTNIASSDSGEQNQSKLKDIARDKINGAESAATALENFIESNKEKIGIEVRTESEDKIKLAGDLILQANDKINSASYGEAFNLAQNAIRIIDKARVLVSASTNFKLDGRLINKSNDNEDDTGEVKGIQIEAKNFRNRGNNTTSTFRNSDNGGRRSRNGKND